MKEPIRLDSGIFIFLKDGSIRWFSSNNEQYQAWLKTKDGRKPSLIMMKDGVKEMMHDSGRLWNLKNCDGDLPDELEELINELTKELEEELEAS